METIYEYSNKQAVDDGMFADVTPASQCGKMTWLVTSSIFEAYSLAAIAEFYNETVTAYMRSHSPDDLFPVVSKMNGKAVWCYLEKDAHYGPVFKACFPEEA